jgi:hypothetical protein
MKDIASYRFHIVACRDAGGRKRELPCKKNGRRGILYSGRKEIGEAYSASEGRTHPNYTSDRFWKEIPVV